MNVGEMQKKLSQRVEQDPERKFSDLHNLLYDRQWLHTAYQHVRRNAGSKTAGTDGVTMAGFEGNLEENLQHLSQTLKAGTFKPTPVRRVYIPKSNGKKRPLGIPTIADRIVQEALRMILEPIWEADFSRHSYGFRPLRCTKDAVEYLGRHLAGPGGYYWCIEGDITSYFDTIHHRKLMKLLQRRIADKAILDLIWRFLKAGIMEKGVYQETIAGTPQGGIVSPLLANIYLHELDRYMEKNHLALGERERMRRRRNGMANFLYVRYADDWVVLSNGTKAQTEAFCEELRRFLKTTLRLELSTAKTKVTHLTEGFQFLGFHIERSLGQKGTWVPRIRIPQTAQRRLLDKMMRMLAPNTHEDAVNAKIAALNKVIGGWCRYYQHSSGPARTFSRLSNRIFWLVAHWLGRKYRSSIAQVMRKFYRDGAFQTNSMTLVLPQRYKPKRYKLSVKPTPYTHSLPIEREELPQLDTVWIGGSNRNADIRAEVRATLGPICANCGVKLPWSQLHVDHKRPVRTFPSLRQADGQSNHHILCQPCHTAKAKSDRQVLSRVR